MLFRPKIGRSVTVSVGQVVGLQFHPPYVLFSELGRICAFWFSHKTGVVLIKQPDPILKTWSTRCPFRQPPSPKGNSARSHLSCSSSVCADMRSIIYTQNGSVGKLNFTF